LVRPSYEAIPLRLVRDTVAVLVVSDADPETRSRSILTLFDPW
jgi:hypothetical protein